MMGPVREVRMALPRLSYAFQTVLKPKVFWSTSLVASMPGRKIMGFIVRGFSGQKIRHRIIARISKNTFFTFKSGYFPRRRFAPAGCYGWYLNDLSGCAGA